MMKNTFKMFSFLFVFALATTARAGIMIEPYLGYELGSEAKLESGGTNDGGKTSGLDLGLRVAYTLPVMVWIGLDYSMMSDGKFKGDSSANDGKMDRSNLYLDVGVDLPILARAWVGYGLMNSAKLKFDGGGSTTLKKGTNLKFGVGFTALPIVSLNLEYFMHDYKDYDSSTGASGSTSDIWSTHKENGLLLSVSAPFEF